MIPSNHQPTSAWALKQVWPEITLHIVPDAGHSSREPGITKLLVEVRLAPLPNRVTSLVSEKAHLVFLRPRINSPTSERFGTSDEREAHDGGTIFRLRTHLWHPSRPLRGAPILYI